tara:strand:- start:885 stop:1580 length:696 start_codon:yes stop_codon:yes gene_type:complete
MFRRLRVSDKRKQRRALTVGAASDVIGELGPGVEVFGVNKGQFSLIDILEHCLSFSGPSKVVIATWTAAQADLAFAYEFLADERITDLRFVLDFSFPSRQPEYFAALVERFGASAVRLTKTHAKLATVEGADLKFCIRSSMNLNENRRLEFFEISEDAAMCEFVRGLTDELWQTDDDGLYLTPYEMVKRFEEFGLDGDGQPLDGSRFFGDGEYERDLRRIGWSTQAGHAIK